MNKLKTFFQATASVVMLVVIFGLFGCQSRTTNAVETGEQTAPELDSAAEATPVLEPAARATPELEAYEGTLDEQLSAAVIANDTAAVEQLLNAGAHADAINSAGDPILKLAISDPRAGSNTSIFALLMTHGADVNALDKNGNSLLPLAAGAGHLEIVQLLLDAGADVNSTMSMSVNYPLSLDLAPYTLVHAPSLNHATLGNHIEVVKLLIASGADLNQGDQFHNETALHEAAMLNNDEIIKILLDHGADPNPLVDYEDVETPLHTAALMGLLEAAEALLDGGADVDAQVDQGLTPLMTVLKLGSSETVARMVPFLLDRGADPNRLEYNDSSALHYAARGGWVAAIPILIEHDASIDLQNNTGITPLHQAAKWNQSGALSILLDHGASTDLKNAKGETALEVAVDDAIVKILREAGAEG